MKIDEKLTRRIQAWLDTPAKKRNINEGAILLLKMNNNKILYRNIIMNPKKYGDYLEQELQKRLNYRVQQITHEQVEEMRDQVTKIEERHFLLKEENPAEGFKAGKREDHDQLPEDIQAAYADNLGIMQRMRMLHGKLVLLEEQAEKSNTVCKDSDRYPFLKELIELDKQYHDNWAKYDGYNLDKGAVEQNLDSRAASKRAANFINLNKGRYRKNPTDELKKQLADNYAVVVNPTEKMTNELKELGVIE